jgi:ABC-type sugar transport system ATPase subunit
MPRRRSACSGASRRSRTCCSAICRARGGWIDWHAAHRQAGVLFAKLGWPDLDVRKRAGALPAPQRQVVEVAKAISIAPRVLILDEPTAALAHEDVARLVALIRRLRDDGTAIVYISHRLDEIFELAVPLVARGRRP